jgi:hypothetical protein
MKEDRFEYDVQKRARAGTAATFRALVSAYLIYLGWSVLRGVLNGSSTVPVWLGWLIAVFFTGAALAFGFYTWKTWRRDLEAARLPAYDGNGEEDAKDAEETEEAP